MMIYRPLFFLDDLFWHPSGFPQTGRYPIDKVEREDIWKVYKAYGFFDKNQPSQNGARHP